VLFDSSYFSGGTAARGTQARSERANMR